MQALARLRPCRISRRMTPAGSLLVVGRAEAAVGVERPFLREVQVRALAPELSQPQDSLPHND